MEILPENRSKVFGVEPHKGKLGENITVNIFTEHPLREVGLEKLRELGIDIPQSPRTSSQGEGKPREGWYIGELSWDNIQDLANEEWVKSLRKPLQSHLLESKPGFPMRFS